VKNKKQFSVSTGLSFDFIRCRKTRFDGGLVVKTHVSDFFKLSSNNAIVDNFNEHNHENLNSDNTKAFVGHDSILPV